MAGGAAAGQQQFPFLFQNYTTKKPSFVYKILTHRDIYMQIHLFMCRQMYGGVHSYISLCNM